MTNIKKTILKEAKKIAGKNNLDITPEELANLALFKVLNLPYFQNVNNFIKTHYNIFDEICIGNHKLNNVKGYTNSQIKSFVVKMDIDEIADHAGIDSKNQILTTDELQIFKSFINIINESKNLNEVVLKCQKIEESDPFYFNKILNITQSTSYEGSKLVRAVNNILPFNKEESLEEYEFDQITKTQHYRGRSYSNDIKDFVYNHYSFKDLSSQPFETILEKINQRDIDALTGVPSLTKEDLKNFHQTHPNEYAQSIFKIFKEIPKDKDRCNAAFDLIHFNKEIKLINKTYKRLLSNPTSDELLNKYDDFIQPIVDKISIQYPQIKQKFEDVTYEIKRFIHTSNKEKVNHIKKESPLEIYQSDYKDFDYMAIRGFLFYKNEYPVEQGFYISANNGLEDIAGAEGFIVESITYSGNRFDAQNIRLSRMYDGGRNIDIKVKQELIEEVVKMAAEFNCPFVHDIIENDKRSLGAYNDNMKLCLANLKEKYPNVIFFNDSILMNEKESLESNIKANLFSKLFKSNTPYDKIIQANIALENFFKTNEFEEILKIDYIERRHNKITENIIESIINDVTKNKKKIKFTP